MIKNKKAAMEMSVGTIVTIVLLMAVLVLGLVLTRTIFTKTTENVDSIDDQLKGEIQNLFGTGGKSLIVGLGGENTAIVKQGTENFGIPFGISPNEPRIWGTNNGGCTYSIAPSSSSPKSCTSLGWTNLEQYIFPGTTNVKFDEVDANNGYALLKITIPEKIPPCIQRFSIVVKCAGPGMTPETHTGYFDLEVIKRGLI